MFPTEHLTLVRPRDAAPGTLALGQPGRLARPMLAMRVPGGPDGTAAFLDLVPKEGEPMRVQLATSFSGPMLALDSWDLRVDPESSYSARSDEARPGDMIFSGEHRGFVAIWDFSEIYVSVDGRTFSEPDWVSNFAGFRKWEIVHRTDLHQATRRIVGFPPSD
jgi:hypothetical protein